MPPRPRPPLQWDLVAESFTEAVFLWARWQDAMDSPRHDLRDVVHWVEGRLRGGIDGTRLGGQRAVDELLLPALGGRRPRPAAVAAHLLASMGRAGIEHVVAAMLAAGPDRLPALRRGLEASAGAQWPSVLVEFLPQLPADVQAAVLDALAFRRWPLPPGIDAMVDRGAKAVQLASLRLATTVRDKWTKPYIEWGLRRSDPQLRVEATRAALLRALEGATAKAGDLIRDNVPGSDVLLPLVASGAGERLLPVIQSRLRERHGSARPLFDALATIGTVAAAQLAASLLDHREHARLAADALRAITGLDPSPPPGVVPEADCPRDELLLPTPAPELLRERWLELRPSLDPKRRYLQGEAFDPEQLPQWLARAPMRRRHALADELAMRTGGASQIVTTTWTRVQWAQLDALRPAAPGERPPRLSAMPSGAHAH